MIDYCLFRLSLFETLNLLCVLHATFFDLRFEIYDH